MIIILLHLLTEAKDIEGLVSEHHVLLVVDGGHGQLALGDVPVVQDVVSQQALWREKFLKQVINILLQVPYLVSSSYLGLEVRDLVGHDVIESMVAPLQLSLEGQPGLLQQVDNHVSARQLTGLVEPDTDELTKPGGVVIPHSLGITPSFQDRVGLDNLVLKTRLAFLLLASGTNGGKV